MGRFSWTCAKTHLPIMSPDPKRPEQSAIVLLFEDGSMLRGSYDGYGRIIRPGGAELDITDEIEYGHAKAVLAKFFAPGTDHFDTLGANQSEPGQGYFHDPQFVDSIFAKAGFPRYEEYLDAFREAYRD